MKIINIVLTIIFVLFAIFQFNDPDALMWILLYFYVAVMSALAIFKRYSLLLLIAGMAIFALYFLYLSPSIIAWAGSGENLMNKMSDAQPFIEQTREAGGLLLGLLTLVFHLIVRNRYVKAYQSPQ